MAKKKRVRKNYIFLASGVRPWYKAYYFATKEEADAFKKKTQKGVGKSSFSRVSSSKKLSSKIKRK